MESVVQEFRALLRNLDPGRLLGAYLTGSSAIGGLRPDSDLDVLLLTRRSLSRHERRDLVDHLLRYSGRRATVRPGRPIEVTSLVLDDIVPWRYPATCDFLYGEWLRSDYANGHLPQRKVDSNLPVLITTAREDAIVLAGPSFAELVGAVPATDLDRSLHDVLPALLDNLVDDERNALLTLARMILTLETGRILPKDQAASYVARTIDEPDRSVLELAAQSYVGEATDDWTTRRQQALSTARLLALRIQQTQPPYDGPTRTDEEHPTHGELPHISS